MHQNSRVNTRSETQPRARWDGIEVIKHVRAWSSVPVIVLSARTLEAQKIAALDAGADDYVARPFSAAELLARVRASLRRNVRGTEHIATVRVGEAEVDLEHRRALGAGGEIHLTPLEHRVLECLARNSGKIVRPQQLLRESGDTRTLRVYIKNLRDKLEPDPRRPKVYRHGDRPRLSAAVVVIRTSTRINR